EARFRTRTGEIITGLISVEDIILHGQECILVMLTDITGRKQAEDLLLASYNQLAEASDLARSLSEILTPEEVYERLEQVTRRILPDISYVYISRYHPADQLITCVYAANEQQRLDLAQFSPIPLAPPGQGTQSQVIHTRQPLVVNDFSERIPQMRVYHQTDPQRQTAASAYVPMVAHGQVLGLFQVQSFTPGRFSQSDTLILSLLGNTAAIALDNARLFGDLLEAYDGIIEAWGRVLELRDQDTEGHTRRVTDLTVQVGRRMGLDETALANLRRGALLHDIGKLAIPDRVLLKPGPLDADEWDLMRKHPLYAYQMLQPLAFLQPVTDIPLCHHERWDGEGYPHSLSGTDIPLPARIFAVVDVWDALNSARPYRPAWPQPEIITYLQAHAGTRFDPDVVRVFLELLEAETGLPSQL
ncbi:MAG TPA: HD domain-containing phosphohydrolase, partial [Anaerolineaceae bacterium]|nr:HD domain-containing phosphohydrolase [Anaerolineaceae bacterium]